MIDVYEYTAQSNASSSQSRFLGAGGGAGAGAGAGTGAGMGTGAGAGAGAGGCAGTGQAMPARCSVRSARRRSVSARMGLLTTSKEGAATGPSRGGIFVRGSLVFGAETSGGAPAAAVSTGRFRADFDVDDDDFIVDDLAEDEAAAPGAGIACHGSRRAPPAAAELCRELCAELVG